LSGSGKAFLGRVFERTDSTSILPYSALRYTPAVCRWWIAVGLAVALGVVVAQQEGGQIRFGKVRITYSTLVGSRQLKTGVHEVQVRGKVNRPVRIASPDQYFEMTCDSLQTTLAPDEQRQLVVRTAQAQGRVNFVYDRPEPYSKLNATANRAVYDGEKNTITLIGDVVMDGEDEFYKIRWRNNEQLTVFLGEQDQRVEAVSKEVNGEPIGTMEIEPRNAQRPTTSQPRR